MMNEFYELKPGETVRNVKMYNSETVLLTDLEKKTNFKSGETLFCNILCSSYYKNTMKNARLDIRLLSDEGVIHRQNAVIKTIENGKVSEIYHLEIKLPETEVPKELKLSVTLDCDSLYAENEWELYIFPEINAEQGTITVSDGMTEEELITLLKEGEDILITGSAPFTSLPCSFKISLAGRTNGNLATVVYDHPAVSDMPHEGFCSWQFAELFDKGEAVCFENDDVTFNPIIEVVSSHKCILRQAAMFEFTAFKGRCMVCSFDFKENDPAASYLKASILNYMRSEKFSPPVNYTEDMLNKLIHGKPQNITGNVNLAFNPNDKTALVK